MKNGYNHQDKFECQPRMKLELDLKEICFQKSTNDLLKFSSKFEYKSGNSFFWGGGMRNFLQITEGQGDVLGEFSQTQS